MFGSQSTISCMKKSKKARSGGNPQSPGRGGKSLKGEALIDASKIGGKGDLFRRGHGINELREMGLAGHEGGVGYFLTERGEEVADGLE